MKVYTTLDCIKLNDFEKMLLLIIKGALLDFHNAQSNPSVEQEIKTITIKPTDGRQPEGSHTLTTFKITNSPKGLFDEIKRIATPFTFGMQFQGGWHEETKETAIILQRFKIERNVLHYYSRV